MRSIATLGLGLLLAGCGSTAPSRFFLLTPMPGDGAAASKDMAVGVGPVTLPAVLDRPQLVTRIGSNELHLDEFVRWGEPLGDNFSAVLIENLGTALGSDRVVEFDGPAGLKLDYRVSVEVHRFDSSPDGGCVLEASWQIYQGEELAAMDRSRFGGAVSSEEPEATVEAMSAATAELSRTIAKGMAALPGK